MSKVDRLQEKEDTKLLEDDNELLVCRDPRAAAPVRPR